MPLAGRRRVRPGTAPRWQNSMDRGPGDSNETASTRPARSRRRFAFRTWARAKPRASGVTAGPGRAILGVAAFSCRSRPAWKDPMHLLAEPRTTGRGKTPFTCCRGNGRRPGHASGPPRRGYPVQDLLHRDAGGTDCGAAIGPRRAGRRRAPDVSRARAARSARRTPCICCRQDRGGTDGVAGWRVWREAEQNSLDRENGGPGRRAGDGSRCAAAVPVSWSGGGLWAEPRESVFGMLADAERRQTRGHPMNLYSGGPPGREGAGPLPLPSPRRAARDKGMGGAGRGKGWGTRGQIGCPKMPRGQWPWRDRHWPRRRAARISRAR